MKFRGLLILLFLTLFSVKSFATHIVGGEIYYDCLGGNNYKITLKVYRDCYYGIPPFDSPGYIGVYDSNGSVLQTVDMGVADSTLIPAVINNPCFTPPVDVCVEEGVYIKILNLPPIAGGYVLSYQRCCRNSSILNIVNASQVGATYQIPILDVSIATCNSTPRYTNFPPLFLCAGVPFSFDHSATDPDGDSLYYQLCDAYEGADASNPTPVPPSPPPYTFVSYTAPYSGANPMSSSPSLIINPLSGLMTGTPNMIGRWVVGVCVSEYRNGILLTTNKRDFQFNVENCPNLPVASIPLQSVFCFGNQVHFSQNSINAFSYHWDFGESSTVLDVSAINSPTWTYADTGSYNVTLIINPGSLCADTNTSVFRIYPPLVPTFIPPPGECIYKNSFDFTAAGAFMGNGTFNWNFGANANPSTSTQQNPTNIVFNSVGTFPVILTVNENGCTTSYTNNVLVYPKPLANYGLQTAIACDLQPVHFVDSSQADTPLTYVWGFGDETISTQQNPFHTYPTIGTYFTNLIITTAHGCVDTFALPTSLTVFPSPQAGFTVTPKDTSIFYPDVSMTDQSIDAIACSVFWGDGASYNNCDSVHRFNKPGTYTVMQVVLNTYGCYDTAYSEVLIRPEFLFWLPNAFTPNNNELNDVFKPVLLGVHDYSFLIFDRWGEKIYEAKDLDDGWNGCYKSKLCSNDVYVYKITFRDDVGGNYHQYIGRVTLVR